MSEGGGSGGDGGEEKSHEPTQGRIDEARRKGDVPRSADAGAAAAYLGLLAALFAAGPGMVEGAGGALAGMLGQVDRLEGRLLGPGAPGLAASLARDTIGPVLPLLLVPFAATLAAWLAQQAFAVSGEKLVPKLDKISLLANAKKKFGMSGLVEFGKATFKLFAIGAVLAAVLAAETDRILALLALPPRAAAIESLTFALALLPFVAAVAVAVAAVDLVWQRFDHLKKLRMTRQELKDETKRSEGDPYQKAERQRRARSIAGNRMLADVPDADVVIVNPQHYAVALKWSRAKGSAPVCVAKGVDEMARAIREKAAEAGVPVRRDAPAARAIHAAVEIGEEIRREHYEAVAAAIRWAESMRRLARARGGAPPPETSA